MFLEHEELIIKLLIGSWTKIYHMYLMLSIFLTKKIQFHPSPPYFFEMLSIVYQLSF